MWFRSECSKVSDSLWDYSSQRLSAAETAHVERHLQQCARCQAEAEAYRYTVGMLGAARSQPIPASQRTWQDLRHGLATHRQAARRSADLLPRLTLAGAGTALAAMLLVVFFGGAHGPKKTVDAPRPNGPQQGVPSVHEASSPPEGMVAKREPQAGGHDLLSSFLGFGSFFPGAVTRLTSPHANAGPAVEPRSSPPRRRPHARAARLAGPARPASIPADYAAQLDGGNVPPRRQPRNFVLNPVAPPADEEPARRYVMGSIPVAQTGAGVTASSDGTEDGGAW